MSALEYIDLVDRSGRLIRTGKPGVIDDDLEPILSRIKANPETWTETINSFGSKFHVAAGLKSNLRNFAEKIGMRWIFGISAARSAFT